MYRGMFVRLCNIFVGFDENIQIETSASTVLQGRIPATMNRVRKEMKISEEHIEHGVAPFEYWIRCLAATEKDLNELEIERHQWESWLLPLFEPIQNDETEHKHQE